MANSVTRVYDKREDLIWRGFDGKVVAIHKINLIRAIRTAATEGDLRTLQPAKALAEKIVEQVDDEFANLKGHRCVNGHLKKLEKEVS